MKYYTGIEIEQFADEWYQNEQYSSSHIADKESFIQGFEAAQMKFALSENEKAQKKFSQPQQLEFKHIF